MYFGVLSLVKCMHATTVFLLQDSFFFFHGPFYLYPLLSQQCSGQIYCFPLYPALSLVCQSDPGEITAKNKSE